MSSEKKNIKKSSGKLTLKPKEIKKDDFPIVGIGSSAGGLEALEQFFESLSADCGMAFVIIQHLDPTRIDIMHELLQRKTSLKVMQASDQLKVKPGSVYIIPPNKSMSILNGALYLFDPVETRGLRLPIDIFFRSLADDKQDQSIGIILSGMGSDGSLGLKAIKEQNGLVLIQEPSTAKFDGMPSSAINSVQADIVAPANELPEKLISYLNLVPISKTNIEEEYYNKSNIDKIIILLREHSGHDFSLYKKSTLYRRIERRKGVHQINSIENYVRFIQKNPNEVEILFKELLIGVTSFFRDHMVWKVLKGKVLPELIKDKPDGHILRAWIPACSTGEEAYSLAMIFKEIIEKTKKPKNISLQIFATDLDQDAIDRARKGVFPLNILSDVTPERIQSFFNLEGDVYRIKPFIREMVVFAPQNIIKDPPFTKLDFLSCRNMLIYMETSLQQKLIALFNYSLFNGGVLLLGSAETLGNRADAFKDIDTKCKIYKRSASIMTHEINDLSSSFYHHKTVAQDKKISPKVTDSIQALADHILLQQFAPASVLVNADGDILYITGKTGKYLEPAAGKANWNIHAMAREGLKHELHRAFRKVANDFKPLILNNLKVGTNGGTQFVDVTVQRIENPEALKGMIMLVFNDVPIIVAKNKEITRGKKKSSSKQVKELEIEIQHSNEELKSNREEMQASQEELKTTNEELQSTNEELQSTNEELTTSKEEMQSLNEELQTVNAELQSKVSDYVQANDDMKNLLNSIEIATLFLDKELNIRRFTDQLTNVFKIRSIDVGRPFTDLVSDLQYPEIEMHALQVLRTLTAIEIAIATKDERWFNIRIMPYRTMDDRIDGLVITFTDITIAKQLELELKKANEALKKSR